MGWFKPKKPSHATVPLNTSNIAAFVISSQTYLFGKVNPYRCVANGEFEPVVVARRRFGGYFLENSAHHLFGVDRAAASTHHI